MRFLLIITVLCAALGCDSAPGNPDGAPPPAVDAGELTGTAEDCVPRCEMARAAGCETSVEDCEDSCAANNDVEHWADMLEEASETGCVAEYEAFERCWWTSPVCGDPAACDPQGEAFTSCYEDFYFCRDCEGPDIMCSPDAVERRC